MEEISARRIDYLHFKRTFVNNNKKKITTTILFLRYFASLKMYLLNIFLV